MFAVGVIGMDDDETICEHTVPTLTSISRSARCVGWKAAALLARLTRGGRPPKEDLFIEPDRVIARQSTDRLYCGDPIAQQVIDHMRGNLKAQFNVSALAEHAGVSKGTLAPRGAHREMLRAPAARMRGIAQPNRRGGGETAAPGEHPERRMGARSCRQ